MRCIITAAWLLNGVILFWLTQGDNLTGQWIASGAKGLEIPVQPVMFDDQEQSAAKVNQHREAAFVAAQRRYQDCVDKKFRSSVWREPPPGPRGRPPAARRLVCSICKRECKSKANLTKHMRTHESGSESGEEEQRVSCGECGKKFDMRGLNKHMTIHKKVPPSGPASTQPTEGIQAMFALLSAQPHGKRAQDNETYKPRRPNKTRAACSFSLRSWPTVSVLSTANGIRTTRTTSCQITRREKY